jgi:CrcB protein
MGTALPHSPGTWPWATLLVNLTGCLLLGLLIPVVAVRLPEATWPRPFLAVGVVVVAAGARAGQELVGGTA